MEKTSTYAMQFVVGAEFPSTHMDVTADMIRRFAAASYDFNPLHLDPNWMADASFGKTKFGSVIGHGLMTYSLITRMFTDALYPMGGWHERCEVRFKAPVLPGHRITASARITETNEIDGDLVYVAEVVASNQDGVVVASGDAMGRVPLDAAM